MVDDAEQLTPAAYTAIGVLGANQGTNDLVRQELDVIVERWRADGVDFVFDTVGLDRPLAAVHRAGLDNIEFATSDNSFRASTRFQSGATETEAARTVIVVEQSPESLLEQGHEPTVACVGRGTQRTRRSRRCSTRRRATSTTWSA